MSRIREEYDDSGTVEILNFDWNKHAHLLSATARKHVKIAIDKLLPGQFIGKVRDNFDNGGPISIRVDNPITDEDEKRRCRAELQDAINYGFAHLQT